jgi:diguanylate cyclase (GGDEF)-like protein
VAAEDDQSALNGRESNDAERRVRLELAANSVEQVDRSLIPQLFAIVMIVMLFRSRLDTDLIWWWAAAAVLNVIRAFAVNVIDKRRLANGRPPAMSPFVNVANSVFFGAMWGSLISIAEIDGDATDQAMAIVINLAALSMTAVVSAGSRSTYFSVLVGSLAALVVGWSISEDLEPVFVGLCVMYFFVAGYLHDTVHRMLRSNTAGMFRNEELANQLAEALANRDPLTGLLNRSGLAAWTADTLRHTSGQRIAVAVGNVDRLSSVNELFGARHGDRLLADLGARLDTSSGTHTAVARVAGDEFAVVQIIVDHVDGERTRAVLERATAESFEIDGDLVDVSITTATALGAHDDLDNLITSASALVRDERSKRGPSLLSSGGPLHERRALIDELRAGLVDGSVTPWFQPIVSCHDGRIVGWEALARWKHPERGLIPPLSFLGLVELGQLSEAFTDRMLDESIRFAATLTSLGRRDAALVHVNLSAPQARRADLDRTISTMLDAWSVDPSTLTIEMTEQDIPNVDLGLVTNLKAVERLGVGLAIDDFGTGYSSLSHLLDIRATELKVDKRFVDGLPNDRTSTELVRGVLGLAKGMGMITVAEGVETAAQAAFLRDNGCDLFQGYLVSPALCEHDAIDLLTAHTGASVPTIASALIDTTNAS